MPGCMSCWLSIAHYQANLNLQPLLQPGETLRVLSHSPPGAPAYPPVKTSRHAGRLHFSKTDLTPCQQGVGAALRPPRRIQAPASHVLCRESCALCCTVRAQLSTEIATQDRSGLQGLALPVSAPPRVCGCHQHQSCSDLPPEDHSEPLDAGSGRCRTGTSMACGRRWSSTSPLSSTCFSMPPAPCFLRTKRWTLSL